MEKRLGDDEIAKIESVPPPDDDAYAAPTRVGEAAYRMLAEGMAAFDPPPPSAPTPSSAPSKPAIAPLPDAGPLPRPHDDLDAEGTKLMPQPHMVAPRPHEVSPAFRAEPAPADCPPAAPMIMGPAPPPSVLTPPPSVVTGRAAYSSLGTIRPEIIIGVVSFLAVAVPAIVYLMLR